MRATLSVSGPQVDSPESMVNRFVFSILVEIRVGEIRTIHDPILAGCHL